MSARDLAQHALMPDTAFCAHKTACSYGLLPTSTTQRSRHLMATLSIDASCMSAPAKLAPSKSPWSNLPWRARAQAEAHTKK